MERISRVISASLDYSEDGNLQRAASAGEMSSEDFGIFSELRLVEVDEEGSKVNLTSLGKFVMSFLGR